MEKLPEDFKKQWITALRSGEYKQCTEGSMHNHLDNSYCCLAVASVVLHGKLHHSPYVTLPDAINGGFCNPIASVLMDMNDEQKKSFSEIADYIEANL